MDGQSTVAPGMEASAAPHAPLHLRYFSLLRRNTNFRRLWLAQLISEVGDWFYSLAVYDLLLKTTHSGKAVGWAIIIQLLPWFFMTPLAGALADRFPRRRLMMLADLNRAVIVLGLLLPRTAADVWLVYTLLGLEVIFASVFEPARNALLPNITSAADLLSANALSSATWSVALTVGASIGGIVTDLLGRQAAFVINSLSFFASASLIYRIAVRESHVKRAGDLGEAAPRARRRGSLREAGEFFWHHPEVVVLVFAKAGLGLVGGVLLLHVFFGEHIFPIAGHGALAMGLLYAARGVGAGLGPLLGDHLVRGSESAMWKSISISFFVMGTSYVAFSRAPNLPLAALAVCCGHMGASNIWVMSTTLLQLHVSNRFRGRVFAVDFGLNQFAAATSTYFIGVGLDKWKFSAREIAAALGFALMLPGFFWLPAQATWAKRTDHAGE